MRTCFSWLGLFAVLLHLESQAQTYNTNNVQVENFVGSGFYGLVDGQGELTMFYNPLSVVADSSSNLFVLDQGNEVIRKVTPDGTVTTFAGGGSLEPPGYGTNVYLSSMQTMTKDHDDNLWVAGSYYYPLLKIQPDGLVIGFPSPSHDSIDGLCVDSSNRLYAAVVDNRIYRQQTSYTWEVFAGSGNDGDADGNWIFTSFNRPAAMVADSADNIYVWDSQNHLIRRINQNRDVTTIAGQTGVSGNADGQGTNATFGYVYSMVPDHLGNIHMTCGNWYYGSGTSIRRLSPGLEVTTVAGSFSEEGYVNGPGNTARFNGAHGITAVGGTLFIGDRYNHRVRRILVDPPPPPIENPTLAIASYAGVEIDGSIGSTYEVESSTDRTNWVHEATLILTTSPHLWMDPAPMGPGKFYRASLIP